MLISTRGMVISSIKFKETSIIAKAYTRDIGLVSFLANGVRSKRSKSGMGYFQPLSILDLTLYHNPNREIHRLSDFKFGIPTPNIVQDIRKSAIALFLSEILDKLLRHESRDVELFNFLEAAITSLNDQERVENFHLRVLLRLCSHLGISISEAEELDKTSKEGISTDERQLISHLLNSPVSDDYKSSGKIRIRCLEILAQYIEYHGLRLGKIRSMDVLRQIFH